LNLLRENVKVNFKGRALLTRAPILDCDPYRILEYILIFDKNCSFISVNQGMIFFLSIWSSEFLWPFFCELCGGIFSNWNIISESEIEFQNFLFLKRHALVRNC